MTQPPPPPSGRGEPSDRADAPAAPGFPAFAPPSGGAPGSPPVGGQPGPAGAGSVTWGSWTAPVPGPMPAYAAPGPWPSAPAGGRRVRVHLIWLAVSLVSLVLGGVAGFAIGKAAPQISAAIRSAKAATGVGPCPSGTLPPSVGSA